MAEIEPEVQHAIEQAMQQFAERMTRQMNFTLFKLAWLNSELESLSLRAQAQAKESGDGERSQDVC